MFIKIDIIALILLTWEVTRVSLAPGTFSALEIASTSSLTVTESVFRRTPTKCLNWCTTKFEIHCKIVLFNSENNSCQRVIGELKLAERQQGTNQWAFVRYTKGKRIRMEESRKKSYRALSFVLSQKMPNA